MPSRQRLLFFPLVLLVVALIIFFPGMLQVPLGGLLKAPSKNGRVKADVKIWANTRSGLYYCKDSKLYGKLTPGLYMLQSKAIQTGYQPAEKTCP